MKGQAYILVADSNGNYNTSVSTEWKDIYEKYGVTLTRGWREALLKPASNKDFSKNDSRLEDGIRMVAKAKYAKKKEREVQLSFILEGSSESDYLQKYEDFLTVMCDNGLIYLKIPAMKRVFKVVYSDCQKYGDDGSKCGNFTLKLTEPNPKDRLTITE